MTSEPGDGESCDECRTMIAPGEPRTRMRCGDAVLWCHDECVLWSMLDSLRHVEGRCGNCQLGVELTPEQVRAEALEYAARFGQESVDRATAGFR